MVAEPGTAGNGAQAVTVEMIDAMKAEIITLINSNNQVNNAHHKAIQEECNKHANDVSEQNTNSQDTSSSIADIHRQSWAIGCLQTKFTR